MKKRTSAYKMEGMRVIGQFPHCDSRVLHAPGECEYCDHHPEWQELRIAWGICFTGYEPTDDKEMLCPSERHRPLEMINRWPGNRPATPGEPEPHTFT